MAGRTDPAGKHRAALRSNHPTYPSGKPSWKETEKGLNKIADTLGRNRLARDIESEEIVELIRPIYERGAWSMADHVRCYIHAAYSWGMKSDNDYRNTSPGRFRIPFNPASGIPTEPKVQGTRWLRGRVRATLSLAGMLGYSGSSLLSACSTAHHADWTTR
jgi:hypothetical protein